MWFVFALLSAVFAAATSILAKVGIEGVNSNLATALRTVVVLIMAWGMVFLTNAQAGLGKISGKSWLFLVLSGLATGASSTRSSRPSLSWGAFSSGRGPWPWFCDAVPYRRSLPGSGRAFSF